MAPEARAGKAQCCFTVVALTCSFLFCICMQHSRALPGCSCKHSCSCTPREHISPALIPWLAPSCSNSALVPLSPRRRERHAKTIDIAQEEVLTCLGIHLYERLHRIWQKLRAEEQTWQMLFYLGVDALRKSFEVKTSTFVQLGSELLGLLSL